ncbi:hypothetical protein CYLTODRAFT_351569 [Cylindrobasidium torrendii FP15055 ss-10]|uniref:Uncharacterized protein n=1 Tax=Cylindrobasidium torrendii FP15055 ss-10 TaxID=1314674 RepID=A0A0D7BCR6_9AGAR|nr:hypothetical protein CYLTODRAFT_351569 [Cylindrobasidium torrendii FP15055 ss-10]
MTILPAAAGPVQYIPLLQGEAVDIDRFAGAEQSDWILSIAHDICDPLLSRGVLCVQAPNNVWRHIRSPEPLTDTTYLYELPSTAVVGLCKISLRDNRSRTDTTGDAADMRTAVLQRDASTCWITRASDPTGPFLNSHICPKRMGDAQAQHILETFCGYQGSNISVFHPMFGITLLRSLEVYFDSYDMGFRRMSPSHQYKVHAFGPEKLLSIAGMPQIPGYPIPPLHNYIVNNAPTPGHTDNPLPGLFRWHYLQCVLRQFATHNYRRQPNVLYHEISLPMEGDSDDGTDDGDGNDWPSAGWDRARLAASEAEAERQRQSAVVSCCNEVP